MKYLSKINILTLSILALILPFSLFSFNKLFISLLIFIFLLNILNYYKKSYRYLHVCLLSISYFLIFLTPIFNKIYHELSSEWLFFIYWFIFYILSIITFIFNLFIDKRKNYVIFILFTLLLLYIPTAIIILASNFHLDLTI